MTDAEVKSLAPGSRISYICDHCNTVIEKVVRKVMTVSRGYTPVTSNLHWAHVQLTDGPEIVLHSDEYIRAVGQDTHVTGIRVRGAELVAAAVVPWPTDGNWSFYGGPPKP